MARKTRTQSVAQIAANFPDNNSELITPVITREYLLDNIDSTQYLDLTSTRAALQTIQAANGLVLDQWYKLTNAATSKVLLIKASSANTFYPNADNLTDGNTGTYDIGTNVFTAAAGGGGGGAFIPLAGTTTPITGKLQFDNFAGPQLSFGSGYEIESNTNQGFLVSKPNGGAVFGLFPNEAITYVGDNSINIDTSGMQLFARSPAIQARMTLANDLVKLEVEDINGTGNVTNFEVKNNRIKIQSGFAGFAGIEETTNYSANYTALSLVNKAYVDSKAGGINSNGQNSITLQSVSTGNPAADQLTNGNNLLAALAAVNALDWGTRSDSNRGAVNLFPGTWDAGSTTITMFPFIDIVGLSTDRKATIIIGSGMVVDQKHIDFNTSNAGLHNLTLIANVTNDAVMLGGGAGCFPICENVYFGSENMFITNANIAGFADLDGAFNNCEFKSGINFGFYASGNMIGAFTNNVFGDVVGAFGCGNGDLSGKFVSNKMRDGGSFFKSTSGNITGIFTQNSSRNLEVSFASVFGNITGTITDFTSNGNIICASFTGKLIRCNINTIGRPFDAISNIGDGALIERCTIKAGIGLKSLFSATPVTIESSFSEFSEPWSTVITNSLSTIPVLDKMGLRDGQNVLIGVPAYGSSARGTTTITPVLATTTYTRNHNQSFTPSMVTIQEQSPGAASAMSFVDNITETTFDITFLAVPTGTPVFGFVAYT